MPNIILASKSPRRKELLSTLVDNFSIEISNFDENTNRPTDIYLIPKYLAYQKAKVIQQLHPFDIIIGSDTIVIIDNKVLEKPENGKEAKQMLNLLNNTTHEVISGVCILYKDKIINYDEKAYVTFNNLSDAIINAYIATGDPYDKAGGYAIQNPYFSLVKEIKGEYETVVGLPLKRLKIELDKLLTN